MLRFAATTHPGLKRSVNQDCFDASPELGLWLVADGVGGHADGERASAIARETIVADIATGSDITAAIAHAHQAILADIDSASEQGGNMGSTIVAFRMLDDKEFEIAWVGDSRAYLYDGELRQLTRDHNPISELVAQGVISREQGAKHPERHMLSQSLGVSQQMQLEPGYITDKLSPGAQILLCSDGLTDELSDEQIAQILRKAGAPQEQLDALINAALEAGGADNVTVVVVGSPEGDQRDDQSEATKDTAAPASERSEKSGYGGKLFLTVAAIAILAIGFWIQQ